ncbi:zinc ribbon domain-containing protein [Variovorax paradoxus]|nr:zinc ribbon domain-containing protein [Variovorax paradoxus]MBT2303815.1 zinc ribbon domain-containing protein [Variovorax paradoxus]
MPEFKIAIASETPCPACGIAVPLETTNCPSCSAQAPHRLTFSEFFTDLEQFRIMDARHGGLVLGRDGPDDDIPMYRHAGDGIFEVAGVMQGGEFIVSKAATEKHRAELELLNSEKGGPPYEMTYALSLHSSVINTNFLPQFGGLWISWGQFIINRFATAKHLATLERMNAEGNPDSVLHTEATQG